MSAKSPPPSSASGRRGSLQSAGSVVSSAASRPTSALDLTPSPSPHVTSANPVVLSQGATPKQRKAARDEAERLAREEATEISSLKAYNEMLKTLLSKELSAREIAEKRAREVQAAFESFKTSETETLRGVHQAAMAQLEITLAARFKVEHEASLAAQVTERVQALRAEDQIKYRNLKEIHAGLTTEFDAKYATRLQKAERETREVTEASAHAIARAEHIMGVNAQLVINAREQERLVLALEHRCASLERLKHDLRSFRTLVKFLCARVFVNTVRLKKHLHSTYDSLRMLHEKLNFDVEYDRTSEVILPQHELEVWLGKTHTLLTRNKAAHAQAQANFAMLLGATVSSSTSQALANSFVHPNTLTTTASLRPDPPSSPSTQQLVLHGSSATSPISPRRARQSGRTPSGSQRFFASLGVKKERKIVGHGGNGMPRPSLNFREMLQLMSEVETVLRGCLVECLNKAAEWKASSEDFFARNQELVSEAIAMRAEKLRNAEEVQGLQTACALLEKSLNAQQDERKALREIDAQAPTNKLGMGTHSQLKATSKRPGMMQASSHQYQQHVRQTPSYPPSHQQSHDSINPDRIQASIVAASVGGGGGLSSGSGLHDEPAAAAQTQADIESAALSLIASHERANRLASTDGTSAAQLEALSSIDLTELAKGRGRMAGPRGFFDHHNALMKCTLAQKQHIEALQRAQALLKRKVDHYKTALAAEREKNRGAPASGTDLEWEAGLRDGDDSRDHPDSEDDRNARDEKEQDGENDQVSEVEPTPPQQSRKIRGGGSSAAASRPQQLDVDTTDDRSSRIRASIPFSPPVYPVSPYAPRTHSSASGGLGSSRSHTPAASPHQQPPAYPTSAFRGPALTMTIPGANGSGGGGSGTASPYERSHSAHSSRVSAPGQFATNSAALASTQPISTASASYSSARVYGVVGPSSSSQTPTPHQASRGPERVYAHTERPRTGGSTPGAGGPITREHFSRPSTSARTVNPLLAGGGLVSASTVAAALTASPFQKLHPALVVTGDVRYDVISPYTAQPLPWEARDPVRYTASPRQPPQAPAQREKKPRPPAQQVRGRSQSPERVQAADRARDRALVAEAERLSSPGPGSGFASTEEKTADPSRATHQLELSLGSGSNLLHGLAAPPEVTSSPRPANQPQASYALAGKESLTLRTHATQSPRDEPEHATLASRTSSRPPSSQSTQPARAPSPPASKKAPLVPPPALTHQPSLGDYADDDFDESAVRGDEEVDVEGD